MTRHASFRLIAGLLVAALWLPLLLYFTSGGYGPFWLFMTGFYTVPLTLLVAAPLVFLFRHRISLALCLVVGLAIGFLGSLTFLATTNYLAALHWAPLLIVSGLVSSFLFWLVAVFRNGDLTIVGGVRER
jgi:hypothetical protein